MSFSSEIEAMARGAAAPAPGGRAPLAVIAASSQGRAAPVPPLVRHAAWAAMGTGAVALAGYPFVDDVVAEQGIHGWVARLVTHLMPWAPILVIVSLLALALLAVITEGFTQTTEQLAGYGVIAGAAGAGLGAAPLILGAIAIALIYAALVALGVAMFFLVMGALLDGL